MSDEIDDAEAWRLARHDMLRAHLLEMPTPEDVAYHLPLELAEAVKGSWQTIGGFRVAARYRDELFSRGLVGSRTSTLGVFGMQVRRVLLEEERT